MPFGTMVIRDTFTPLRTLPALQNLGAVLASHVGL
jgi:hypothetical protein